MKIESEAEKNAREVTDLMHLLEEKMDKSKIEEMSIEEIKELEKILFLSAFLTIIKKDIWERLMK